MNEIIERCIFSGINLYGYFILNSLYNEEGDKIIRYCTSVDKILTKDFLWLVDGGYLEPLKNRDVILIEDLILTDKFSSEILKITNTRGITFDVAFEQLRDYYPSKAGNSERRLQSGIDKCKVYYKNIIVKNGRLDEELHSVILQCINYEIKIRTKARSLEYFKLLTTWLNQKEYEVYYDEVIELIKKEGSVDPSSNDELSEDRL